MEPAIALGAQIDPNMEILVSIAPSLSWPLHHAWRHLYDLWPADAREAGVYSPIICDSRSAIYGASSTRVANGTRGAARRRRLALRCACPLPATCGPRWRCRGLWGARTHTHTHPYTCRCTVTNMFPCQTNLSLSDYPVVKFHLRVSEISDKCFGDRVGFKLLTPNFIGEFYIRLSISFSSVNRQSYLNSKQVENISRHASLSLVPLIVIQKILSGFLPLIRTSFIKKKFKSCK